MPKQARVYWSAVVLSGFSLSGFLLAHWTPDSRELFKLLLYGLAAILTSGFKVWLPGIFSTLSMNYVFIIAGILDLHLAGGILVGIAGVVGQTCYKNRGGTHWEHTLFNIANVSLSVAAAGFFWTLHPFASSDAFGIFAVICASAAYFAVNTVLLSGMISLTGDQKIHQVWKESYLWTSPQYLVGGLIAIALHLLMYHVGWVGVVSTFPVMYLLYRSYKIYLSRVEEQQEHLSDMAKLHLRTIEALALAIDAKDDTTAAHLRRVQVYASEIGKELGLSKLEMQALEAAALLHDIGKLAVPEYIISKPGKLTPDEFEKMKVHPIVGAEILERVNFPYPVVPIVRAHHEKYDGSGYPYGLKGEEIPIGARILSVVDCMDAMASDRQYRKALPLEEAMQAVERQAGISYDPKVVAIMKERYHELEAKAKTETADMAKLSSNIKVERGECPATGFAAEPVTLNEPSTASRNFQMRISDARREFQTLVEIANDLGSSLSLNETLALLAARLEKSILHDAVAIYLRSGNELVPRYVKGESFRLFSSLRIPLGQGLSGWVAENDQPMLNGNPAVESGYLDDPSKVTSLRSAIAVPLRCREQVVGVLTLYQLQTDAFTVDHKRILLNISEKVGTVIANALKFEQMQGEARQDDLTGLLNSRSLFEGLAQRVLSCQENCASLAVVVMDLDGFKMANDQHGHLTGDRVLQQVATGLKGCCREGDLLGRWGGDEFVLVLSDPGDYVGTLLARISEVGKTAASAACCRTPLSISAGYAVYPGDETDAEGLLEKADERMYEEKRRRKSVLPASLGNIMVFPRPIRKEVDVLKVRQSNAQGG